MIDTELRPPAMGAMVRLADDVLLTQLGGADLVEELQQLDLGCYVDPRGYYWFGANDLSVSEHSRWITMMEKQALLEAGAWDQAPYFSIVRGALAAKANTRSSLDWGLRDVRKKVAGVIEKITPPNASRTGEKIDPALLAKGIQIWSNAVFSVIDEQLMHLTWDQEMHELMHHYHLWQARHPETVGMPHELVLRMHGLGRYVDWLQSTGKIVILKCLF